MFITVMCVYAFVIVSLVNVLPCMNTNVCVHVCMCVCVCVFMHVIVCKRMCIDLGCFVIVHE